MNRGNLLPVPKYRSQTPRRPDDRTRKPIYNENESELFGLCHTGWPTIKVYLDEGIGYVAPVGDEPVARKVGFRLQREYTIYKLWIPASAD